MYYRMMPKAEGWIRARPFSHCLGSGWFQTDAVLVFIQYTTILHSSLSYNV
jgi:hypothetical protein